MENQHQITKCYENQRKTIVFWPRGAWGPRTVQKFPPGGPGRFQGTPAVVTLGSQGWPIGTQTHGLSGDPGGPKQWVSIGLIAFGDFMWFSIVFIMFCEFSYKTTTYIHPQGAFYTAK